MQERRERCKARQKVKNQVRAKVGGGSHVYQIKRLLLLMVASRWKKIDISNEQ